MFKRLLTAALLLVLATQFVQAHDVWIDNRDATLVVLRGHSADNTEPYDPANVKDPKALDSKGQALAMEIAKGKEGASLSPKGTAVMVAAVYEGGYWVKTTEGWKKMNKREATGKFDIVEAIKSKTCCKRFLSAGDAFAKPVGQHFEIVPQKDPATLKKGDKLPIKVLLDGKPLEGAIVATGMGHGSDAKDALKTDKNGMATVVIEQSGKQMMKAKHKLPVKDDPDADVFYLSSTMTFDVP